MIDMLIKYWDFISYLGVSKPINPQKRQKTVWVNRTLIISALLNALLSLSFRSALQSVGFFDTAIAFTFIYFSILTLNYFQLFNTATFVLFASYSAEIFLLASTLGEASSVHFLYVVALFALLTSINISNRILLFSTISVPILCLILLYITHFSLLAPAHIPAEVIPVANFFTTIFCVVAIIVLSYLYVGIGKKNAIMLKKEIAEREQKEFLLRQSEAKLKALIENTKDNIWSVDMDFRLIAMNSSFTKSMKKSFNFDPKAGDIILDYFPPSMRAYWQPIYERAIAGESAKVEWVFFNELTSKSLNIETQVSPIRNEKNEILGATFFSRDTSQRKESERLLRQKDLLLHAINHNIKEGIFRSSLSKGAIYVNQAYIKMFGYDSIDEILKLSFSALYANDEDRVGLVKALSENRSIDNQEVLFKRKDGSTFWGLISAMLNEDDTDGEKFFDGTIRDITELKNIQFQLEKAKEIAEQSSLVKSQFLSSMSHEIRTPLNAIIGLTRLLSDEDPKPSQLENLNTLRFSAQNLLILINDILDFNKIEAGKVVLENIYFNLFDLLKNIKHGFQIAANENKNAITLSIAEGLPRYVKGDPTRLSQILTNLVGNAIKFTKSGTISITLTLLEKNSSKASVLFEIADTGIGIPEDKQQTIFESFTQATQETTRKYGGTGLGLGITKRLLEMQDSKIMLKSMVGKGSTFSFILHFDYEDRNQEVTLEPAKSIFHPFAKQRVLVVEDNLANQLVAKKFLGKWELNVSIAEDGEVALKLLEKQAFDLILMDIQMPNMDGYEATREIRKIQKYEKTPIIALTASISSGISEKVFEAGMNDHILKPFEPELLYTKIEYWLNHQ